MDIVNKTTEIEILITEIVNDQASASVQSPIIEQSANVIVNKTTEIVQDQASRSAQSSIIDQTTNDIVNETTEMEILTTEIAIDQVSGSAQSSLNEQSSNDIAIESQSSRSQILKRKSYNKRQSGASTKTLAHKNKNSNIVQVSMQIN